MAFFFKHGPLKKFEWNVLHVKKSDSVSMPAHRYNTRFQAKLASKNATISQRDMSYSKKPQENLQMTGSNETQSISDKYNEKQIKVLLWDCSLTTGLNHVVAIIELFNFLQTCPDYWMKKPQFVAVVQEKIKLFLNEQIPMRLGKNTMYGSNVLMEHRLLKLKDILEDVREMMK